MHQLNHDYMHAGVCSNGHTTSTRTSTGPGKLTVIHMTWPNNVHTPPWLMSNTTPVQRWPGRGWDRPGPPARSQLRPTPTTAVQEWSGAGLDHPGPGEPCQRPQAPPGRTLAGHVRHVFCLVHACASVPMHVGLPTRGKSIPNLTDANCSVIATDNL